MRPRVALDTLAGELVEHIAQGLAARAAHPRAAEGAALKDDRRAPRQGLHAGSAGVAQAVLAPFRQEARRNPGAHPRQAGEESAIVVDREHAGDRFVVLGHLLHDQAEVGHQGEQVARLGLGDRWVRVELRPLGLLPQLLGFLRRMRIVPAREQGGKVRRGRRLEGAGRGERLEPRAGPV
jgi:hypothetical protein